jgi:hypothetical protein
VGLDDAPTDTAVVVVSGAGPRYCKFSYVGTLCGHRSHYYSLKAPGCYTSSPDSLHNCCR